MWNVNKEYQNKDWYILLQENSGLFCRRTGGIFRGCGKEKLQKKTEGDPAERQQEPDVIPENIMIMNRKSCGFQSIGSVRSDVGNIAVYSQY